MSRALKVASAPLPVSYQEACAAIAKCARVDECRDWKVKAEALASYARQMRDDTLQRHAQRIALRAQMRAGELLAELEKAKPKPNSRRETGSPRQQAAKDAGFTPKQAADAVAAAKVPKPEAEALIESQAPPTSSEMADLGRTPRVPKLTPAERAEGAACTPWMSAVKHLSTLPDYELTRLAGHPGLTLLPLLQRARAARANLDLWIAALRETGHEDV